MSEVTECSMCGEQWDGDYDSAVEAGWTHDGDGILCEFCTEQEKEEE